MTEGIQFVYAFVFLLLLLVLFYTTRNKTRNIEFLTDMMKIARKVIFVHSVAM